jgi:isoleucyl-tRNA synthetase
LVYQAQKPVFWSTGAQTALAEAEVEYQERDDTAVYVKFPIVSGPLAGAANMVIWTTTPWTLPANLAIAVDPNTKYVVHSFEDRDGLSEPLLIAEPLVDAFCKATNSSWFNGPEELLPKTIWTGKELEGSEAQHPFLERRSKILTADFVTMDTGTGAVHIAPGHGEDDYWLGKANDLGILSPVDDHGRFTEEAGLPNLTGKYVFDANRDIVQLLKERGMLLAVQNFHHSYPYCWRSKTPIIFRNVEQFFIRIDALRDKALEAIKTVKWVPSWGENRIAGTVESRPDWVISRQRSWGVPLPVFYSKDGDAILDAKIIRKLADLVAERGSNIWFELDDATLAGELGLPPGTTKRNDTIDVWIDSGVSHKAVCALHPELRDPADMYLEATDQHRGWFQSSLLTSVALNNRAPYKTCVTHGFVVDLDGKKISKSGTYEKPTAADHFVGQNGADLLRLWASSIDYTSDVPFSEEMFTRLGDTYRRIRNTLRILLGNLYDFGSRNQESKTEDLTLIDRWILNRLAEVSVDCQTGYMEFQFHKVYHTLNQFCSVDLSSLYIDITKDRMYCDAAGSARRRATQFAMDVVYRALVRWLAPLLAFTAEEAWSYRGDGKSVHLQTFPDDLGAWRNREAHNWMSAATSLRALVSRELERARQDKLIGNSLEAAVVLELPRGDNFAYWSENQHELEEILIVSDLLIIPGAETKVTVAKTEFAKCARCWRHRQSVGTSKEHPDLCDRCESVVTALEKAAR